MSIKLLCDAGFPLLTVAVLSPAGILCFRYGIPIEFIVFGLLVAGFKGSTYLRRWLGSDVGLTILTVAALSPIAVLSFKYGIPIELIIFSVLVAGFKGAIHLKRVFSGSASGSDNPAFEAQTGKNEQSDAGSGFQAWRPTLRWRSSKSGEDAEPSVLSWRKRGAADDGKSSHSPTGQTAKKEASRNGLSALRKSTTEIQQWRGLINKFTPEKFDKLCGDLLETLPKADENTVVTDEGFKKVLEELLALIFEASSRQHQYTGMYTDLCQKLLDFVAKQRPDLDGRACIWGKCQHIFLTNVLRKPDIPSDLPEDEYMDRKVKLKEKMVGMVKFGGDLVSRGLVPCEGVMTWIHTLLSERSHETDIEHLDTGDANIGVGNSLEGKPEVALGHSLHEKDVEEREVQLEVLCTILASMGSSLSDSNTWSDENRSVIEDVFVQLEQLSMDTAALSLRTRCLIRDILDLRMAQWKEKEGKLRPATLSHLREEDEADGDLASKSAAWLDPELLDSLQAVQHHVEVIEEKDGKMQRLKALVKIYTLIQEQQILIVSNSNNVSKIAHAIKEAFSAVWVDSLHVTSQNQDRQNIIENFELGKLSVLVLASEVSTRRDFDVGRKAVLINFDFPMTLQLYLYRLHKRTESGTHVYTFLVQSDIRHTGRLVSVMDRAKQKIPPALDKLKDQLKSPSAQDRREDASSWGKGSNKGSGKGHGKGTDDRRSDDRWDDRAGGSNKGPAKGQSRGVDDWRSDERSSTKGSAKGSTRGLDDWRSDEQSKDKSGRGDKSSTRGSTRSSDERRNDERSEDRGGAVGKGSAKGPAKGVNDWRGDARRSARGAT